MLRVGFLGAGTATQAIHLPTLAGLADRFRVTRVMDADPTVAEEIANRCSAVPTTNASSVIEADDVDVVAVCSPDAAHAAQVVAACRAGKRAVLCEKPLAVSTAEVRAVAAAARAVDTLVVVGTMHAYDPGYRAVLRAWEERREQASFVRSTIVLPDNAELIAQTTQAFAVGRDRSTSGDDHPDPAALMRMLVLGLIVHDLPLIRRFRPTLGRCPTRPFLTSPRVRSGRW